MEIMMQLQFVGIHGDSTLHTVLHYPK